MYINEKQWHFLWSRIVYSEIFKLPPFFLAKTIIIYMRFLLTLEKIYGYSYVNSSPHTFELVRIIKPKSYRPRLRPRLQTATRRPPGWNGEPWWPGNHRHFVEGRMLCIFLKTKEKHKVTDRDAETSRVKRRTMMTWKPSTLCWREDALHFLKILFRNKRLLCPLGERNLAGISIRRRTLETPKVINPLSEKSTSSLALHFVSRRVWD